MKNAILKKRDFSVLNLGRVIRGYRSASAQIKSGNIAHDRTFRLYDKNDRLCGYSSQAIIFPVSPDDAARVATFLLPIEDKRFYRHKGLDWRAVARAAVRNFQSARIVQGGSTLSMQLIRNTLIETSPSVLRKVVEIFLARKIERHLSKQEIIRLYCEQVFMGGRLRGLQSAAFYIYRKPIASLSDDELFGLLGLLRAPEHFTPYNSARKYQERQRFICHFLTGRSVRDLRAPNPICADVPRQVRVARAAKRQVRELTNSPSSLRKVGVTVQPSLQKIADDAIREESSNRQKTNICAVVIDNSTGELLVESSWRDGKETDFSPMLEGRIQPGSTFKLFALIAAIEQGFSLDTPLLSAPFCSEYIKTTGGVPWAVRNYGDIYRGEISLLSAFVSSDNCAFARLAEMLDTDRLLSVYRKFGLLGGNAPYSSIVLGTTKKGISPVRLALAYQAIARGGVIRRQCRLLRYAEFADGSILWTPPDHRKEVAIIDANVAEIAQYALRAAACSYGMPQLYAKTGTTDKWRTIVAFGDKMTAIITESKSIFSPAPHEQGYGKDVPMPRRLINKMMDY